MQQHAQASVAEPRLGVAGAMLSHRGCVRELNEDFVAWSLSDSADPPLLFRMIALVADGMGGHAAGEVASEIAGRTFIRLHNELEGSPPEVLRGCMTAANEAIIAHARANPNCAGMGTTCTVLALQDDLAYLAHIGDSRAYLLRQGELYQISEDHSLVAHLVRSGKLSPEEAAQSPDRSSILRALGTHQSADPYLFREGMPVRAGDAFVLCSDGLTDVVDDATIRDVVARLPPDEACGQLIEAAVAAGGPDNISVGIFALGSDPAPPVEARSTRPLPSAVDRQ
jgi:PPM family protein phosphatase